MPAPTVQVQANVFPCTVPGRGQEDLLHRTSEVMPESVRTTIVSAIRKSGYKYLALALVPALMMFVALSAKGDLAGVGLIVFGLLTAFLLFRGATRILFPGIPLPAKDAKVAATRFIEEVVSALTSPVGSFHTAYARLLPGLMSEVSYKGFASAWTSVFGEIRKGMLGEKFACDITPFMYIESGDFRDGIVRAIVPVRLKPFTERGSTKTMYPPALVAFELLLASSSDRWYVMSALPGSAAETRQVTVESTWASS